MKYKGKMKNSKIIYLLIGFSTALIAFIFINFILTQEFIELQRSFFLIFNWLAFCLLGYSLTEISYKYEQKHQKRHRIILVSIISAGFIFSIIRPQTYIAQNRLIYLLFVFIGSFFGCFLASIQSTRMWENNEPPAKSIEQEVLEAHKDYLNTAKYLLNIKRCFDMIFASVSIMISMPAWFLIIFLIWWENPGPVLFVKNSVGVNGINYKQLKFRSMITNAEKDTGPISGYEDDGRVLFFGKFLRKTALDELPQLINILIGDMSYVGPRPQRTVLVHQYLQTIPEYAARHQVRPGLAGLAQVADSYHISPQEKLAWDLIYIENANLWFDLKIIFSAFLLVFVLRWLPNNDPTSTIRKLLKVKKPGLD